MSRVAGHRELAPPSKRSNEGGFKNSVRMRFTRLIQSCVLIRSALLLTRYAAGSQEHEFGNYNEADWPSRNSRPPTWSASPSRSTTVPSDGGDAYHSLRAPRHVHAHRYFVLNGDR